jgi:hypothetical protein
MWWALLEQTVVIGVVTPAPAAFRVVTGLFRQQRRLFRLEVDAPIAVRLAFGLIHDVHGYEGMPYHPQRRRLLAR